MCSVQLEIAEMLCKSFFESQHRTILHTFSSGRLLLANQAVQFTEMFFFLPFFRLEEKIHFPDHISGDFLADLLFQHGIVRGDNFRQYIADQAPYLL